MRNLSAIFLITVLLASCKPEAKVTCLISGSVKNTPDKELRLIIGSQIDTLVLNSDGSFSKEISVLKPADATIRGTKVYLSLYLEPGKNLAVTLDASDMNKNLNYSGSLAAENDFIIANDGNVAKKQQTLDTYYRAPKTPADYKRVRDSIRLAETTFLEKYTNTKGKLSPEFINRQKKTIEFNYYGDMNNYPMIAGYMNTDKPVIPADWYAFMNGVNLDDPTLLDISEVQYFLFSYVSEQSLKAAGLDPKANNDNQKVIAATFSYLQSQFKHPEFFNMMGFILLKGIIEADGTGQIEPQINEYLAKSTDEGSKKTIKSMSEEWAPMAPGQPAPVFNLPDINGKMVSLSDFSGKYVFIDFWATWCGPCKAEVPSYKKLIDDYSKKNIAFISISVDKNKEAWEKMVKEGIPDPTAQADPKATAADKKMVQFTWLQLHDAVKYNNNWLVKYIPTFVLIDPQGKIVNARAARPSTEELRKVLNALPGI